MKVLFAVFLLVSQHIVYGQLFSGTIINEEGQPLANVSVKDTIHKTLFFTDNLGHFTIEKTPQSLFEVSAFGWKTLYLLSQEVSDTIVLQRNLMLLDTVTVTSERIKPVYTPTNINILDYIPNEQGLIILHSKQRQYYLTVKRKNGEAQSFTLDNINPKSLYTDCYGNVHILTKTEAIQIWVDSQLQIIQTVPIEKFNNILKPCFCIFGETFFISRYSNHQKKYTLAMKQRKEGHYTPFFESWDKKAEAAARSLYNEVIYLYMTDFNDTVSNLIENKMWDGDLKKLGTNHHLITRIGFYDKILARPLDIKSFKTEDRIITFDISFDSIHHFDPSGKIVHSTTCSFEHNGNFETVLHDKDNDRFYILSIHNGIYTVQLINIFTGKLIDSFSLKEKAFAEMVKIHDNQLYFLQNQNGFRKLYKVTL